MGKVLTHLCDDNVDRHNSVVLLLPAAVNGNVPAAAAGADQQAQLFEKTAAEQLASCLLQSGYLPQLSHESLQPAAETAAAPPSIE
jgi:hypothetical protein